MHTSKAPFAHRSGRRPRLLAPAPRLPPSTAPAPPFSPATPYLHSSSHLTSPCHPRSQHLPLIPGHNIASVLRRISEISANLGVEIRRACVLRCSIPRSPRPRASASVTCHLKSHQFTFASSPHRPLCTTFFFSTHNSARIYLVVFMTTRARAFVITASFLDLTHLVHVPQKAAFQHSTCQTCSPESTHRPNVPHDSLPCCGPIVNDSPAQRIST
jgi:hypothetical protein